jgi:secondary thiamine-phosphate synthase enzyme
MPAHLKAVILGESLTIPVFGGRLQIGVWQGIYLCEHRNSAQSRKIIVTLNGEDYE